MASTTDTPRASTDSNDVGKPRFAKAYGFAVVTGLFFLLAWFGQFVAQLVVEQNEAAQHGQGFESGRSSSLRSPSSRPRAGRSLLTQQR
jgi:hypothetical protein